MQTKSSLFNRLGRFTAQPPIIVKLLFIIAASFFTASGTLEAARAVSQQAAESTHEGLWIAIAATIGTIAGAIITGYFEARKKNIESQATLNMTDRQQIYKELEDLRLSREHELGVREAMLVENASLKVTIEEMRKDLEKCTDGLRTEAELMNLLKEQREVMTRISATLDLIIGKLGS